jgi:NTE family protein
MSRETPARIVRALIAVAATCCAPLPAAAQSVELAEDASRPRIALVLSGGGARGLAHIGVLKVLQELRVPVDFIVATSMGSIVGGAYAAGHTPAEMEAMVAGVDWGTIFSDRPPREDLSFRRKQDDLRFIGRSELGIKREGLVLPRGAFGAQNLEEFLRRVSRPASDMRLLDQLPIRLRAVATDLESGEPVVLQDVSLSVAMRASMSIPGAFAPTLVDGRLLGDGGLTRNLPVEVAHEVGADIIIAVNVGTPLLPRSALGSAFGVAQQMINILTEQNVGLSLRALRPGDILISPDLTGVSFIDFEQGPRLMAQGEAAARSAAAKLSALSLDPAAYERWEFRRTRHPVEYDRTVEAVVVAGAARTNPEALKREVELRTGISAGDSVSDEQLVKASRILHGSGEFEHVDVYAQVAGGRKSVVIEVEEKPWGPDYLRIGGRAISDLRTDGRFSITLQHTRTWVNPWGAEWRNELQVGDVRRISSSFYQPLGPGSPWFVEPLGQSAESDFDLFTSGNRRTDRLTRLTHDATFSLGRQLGSTAVARVTAGYQRLRSTPLISSRLEGTQRDSARYARVEGVLDTLDDANFPRTGYLVSAQASAIDYRTDTGSPVQAYSIEGLFPVTYGRLTLTGLLGASRSRDDRGGFDLGGFLNLSGTPPGAMSGAQSAFAGALAYYRMGELPRVVGSNWYAGVSLEAGNAWRRSDGAATRGVKKAASLYLGIDSIIGPLYVGYGRTFGGDSAFYFFLGRPSARN